MVFTRSLFFTDGEKEACAIIFKIDGKELVKVKNSKIFAFFPTAKEAHQSFYIHAPFDTTPARDNFKEGADFGSHNIKLVNNICRLITFAFIWLRNNGFLTFSGLNKVYPIYEYEETDILRAIYQNSIDIIRDGEPLLPTNEAGVYKSINEICVPENMGIVNVFTDTDLQYLIRSKMCCGIYYFMVKSIIDGVMKDSKPMLGALLQKGIDDGLKYYGRDISNLTEMAHLGRLFHLLEFKNVPEEEIRTTGYVIDSIEAAVWCLITTDSYKDCMLKAVNLGNDTDTVAAIAGGLAGLYYGYEAIPEDWLSVIKKREWIEQMCIGLE